MSQGRGKSWGSLGVSQGVKGRQGCPRRSTGTLGVWGVKGAPEGSRGGQGASRYPKMFRRVLGVSHPRGRGKSRGSKGVKRDVGVCTRGSRDRQGCPRGSRGTSGVTRGGQGGVQVCQGVKRGVPGFKGSVGDPKGFQNCLCFL